MQSASCLIGWRAPLDPLKANLRVAKYSLEGCQDPHLWGIDLLEALVVGVLKSCADASR